jgi:CheY-like chemotaxis protein
MVGKILLVEDEEEIRGTIAAELDDAGYQVVQAANGREGLEAIRSEKPDLILSDISMPELDGIGLLESVHKELPDQVGTPFIFLTAYSDRDRQIAARRHGADEFLTKPVEIDVLLAVVENQLRKQQDARMRHNEDLVKLFKKLREDPEPPSTGNGSKEVVWTPQPHPKARPQSQPQPAPCGPQKRRHSLGGWITLIGLNEVKEKLGPRWSAVASTVKSLAENKIAQNLTERDTYRTISDDTFEVCIHRRSEAEASATVRRIKQQILDGLGAIEMNDDDAAGASSEDLAVLRQVQTTFYPMQPPADIGDANYDLLDVVSAKIERAAQAFVQNASEMLAKIVQDGEVHLVPILDRNLGSTQFAQCALDPTASSTELSMRAAFAHEPEKMLELDTAKFGLAIQAVISSKSRQFSSFAVSVDVNSIRTPRSRQKYLSLLEKIPYASRSKFVFLIDNGLGQVHPSLLTDIIRSLKPFSITCWLRATTPEPLDKSIDEAVAPVVAINYFDLENAVRTNSEKLKIFRKNLASNKILFMVDGIIDSQQQLKARNIAPNYYCFDGNVDSMYSNI